MENILEKKLKEISNHLDYPIENFPKIGEHNENANPYIQVYENDFLFHYIINERGQEHERKIFTSIDSILYHIVSNITFEMATQYELSHRVENQDCRIILFKKQEELMASINKEWGMKITKENQKNILI